MSNEAMHEDELKAIEARASAATQGPWRSTWGDDIAADAERGRRGEEVTIEAVGLEGLARIVLGVTWYDGPHPCCREEDAAFIEAARSDVPQLVAEVRRLRAEIEATAEMHREDQRRRDELASVPG